MDPTSEDLEQARIGELLEARCQELRLTWNVVAQRSGLSREGLARLRNGVGKPRRLTKRGVEDTVFWRHGSIDRINKGGDPEPYGTIARTDDFITVTWTERGVTHTVRADTGEEISRSTVADPATASAVATNATVTTIDGRTSARSQQAAKAAGLTPKPPFDNPKSKSQEAANRVWYAYRDLAEGDDESGPDEGTLRVVRRGAVDLEELRDRLAND